MHQVPYNYTSTENLLENICISAWEALRKKGGQNTDDDTYLVYHPKKKKMVHFWIASNPLRVSVYKVYHNAYQKKFKYAAAVYNHGSQFIS